MELVSVLLIVFIAFIILKLFAAFFHAGVWLLALPFKLLAVLLSSVIVVFVLVPLGVVAGLVGLLAVPFALLILLAPFLLLAAGLWLLMRRN